MTACQDARAYWAVIPAAGGGSRMGAAIPKQYLPLRARTVIEWSTAVFLACDWISGVVVVLAQDDARFASLPIASHPRLITTCGGAERADSVLAGLLCVQQHCANPAQTRVLVHDAARPCVRAADVLRLRDQADAEHGGLLAIPVTDTLKRACDGASVDTVDRSTLWRAQTPQLFDLSQLINALHTARARGAVITDEASAMEAVGHRPRLVQGDESNLKVTYPADLALADFWLENTP